MSSEHKIRVLIADDHPVVRKGLALMIQCVPDMEVAAEACNGREALEMFRLHRPDVALLDLRMPEMDGLQTITAIRIEYPSARIILLTTFDGDEDIFRALRAGVQAYLLKDTPWEDLLETVRQVHAGKKRITTKVGEKLAERASFTALTERELQVLRMMMNGKSNQEIGADLFIAKGTVKFHVAHILDKLGATDRTNAVITALKRGLATLD